MMYLVSGENKIKMSNFPIRPTATVGLIGLIVLVNLVRFV